MAAAAPPTRLCIRVACQGRTRRWPLGPRFPPGSPRDPERWAGCPQITIPAWKRFTDELHLTNIGYMYVSEHHLLRTNLKVRMREIIRENRKCAPPPPCGSGLKPQAHF